MKQLIFYLTLAISVLAAGCVPVSSTPDEFPIDSSVHTQAAQTIAAELTLSAGSTAVAQLTRLARPTATTFPILLTPLPTFTPLPPTPTPEPPRATFLPTETATPGSCDRAALLSEKPTLVSGLLHPGARFRKTWELINTGLCTWTLDYRIIFLGGDSMGDLVSIPMPTIVPPGGVVEITTIFTAPLANGIFQSEWMLQNAQGRLFGIGTEDEPLRVEVQVAPISSGGRYVQDFALDLCSALWDSSQGGLDCQEYAESGGTPPEAELVAAPGGLGSIFAAMVDEPRLETRFEDEPAIWFRTGPSQGSWVRGLYPPLLINRGYHFVAEFGCMMQDEDCEADFQLDYQLIDGFSGNLGFWGEAYDGRTTLIDVDLSGLSGQWVELILTVTNRSVRGESDVILFAPGVERRDFNSVHVFTWRRQRGAGCDELQVFMLGDQSGEALAFRCSERRDDPIGRVSLSAEEMRSLRELWERVRPFEGEYFPEEGVVLMLQFSGQGRGEVTAEDIRWLDDLGGQLFALILRL